MRLRRRISNCINQNEGSTLITVIVAIAFVTILTTIILGTTVVNVRMKGIDRRTRDDFYYAEKALNDIYTGLGQELAVIAGDEYDSAFVKAGIPIDPLNPSSVDYNLAENAEKEFRRNFVTRAHELVDGVAPAQLEAYITTSGRNTHVDKIGTVEYQKKDGSSAGASDAERVVIPGVQISDTDSSGYRAVITTDIVINVPTVDFLGTNADVSDYGIIANEGLYIEGNPSTTTDITKINGNVYAGVHSTEIPAVDSVFKEKMDRQSRPELFGGINIQDTSVEFTGNYIVSKGDISLAGDAPKLKVCMPSSTPGTDLNLANLWYTTLRTVSEATLPENPKPVTTPLSNATIDIDANVYALNDLALNADNSCVRINGNYYGYNDKSIPKTNVLGIDSSLDDTKRRYDAESSAIIINGSDTYLSMEDIDNFVLMGKAYIDFTSDNETMTGSSYTPVQVVETAESVALKTNQQLYLVPPDFLDGPNPTTEGTGNFTISIPQSDLENWFGYPYLKVGMGGATDIDESYKVTLNDGTMVYYDYLVFNEKTWKPLGDGTYAESSEPLGTGGSVSSKTRFFYEIMTSRKAYEDAYAHNQEGKSSLNDYIAFKEASEIQPSAYRLWERISLSMGWDYFDLRECVIGNGSADAHYYARNAVINYKRTASDIKPEVLDNTDGMFRYARYPENLFYRYVFLCTQLDGKENENIDHVWADDARVDLTKLMSDWTISYSDTAHAAPICHFVDVNAIDNNLIDSSTDLENSVSAANAAGLKTAAYGAVIATDSDISINTSFPGVIGNTFTGVAIVDGDITVKNGIDVRGLLMATGTITLEGDNEITYDKGLIQSRIEKEMNLVKNWDGAVSDAYKNYYLISYLASDASGTPKRIYEVKPGSKIKRERIEADYNDFMHYENWQKGENDATISPTPTPTPTP